MAKDADFSEFEKKAILFKKGKLVNALDLYRPTEFQEPFFLAMEKNWYLSIMVICTCLIQSVVKANNLK
jgi:hypothetical protein